MRVLQINSVCGYGSTGKVATDIHYSLLQEGHESIIAYGRGVANNCDHAFRVGKNLDNYIHFMITRVFDGHGFGSKKATLNFVKAIDLINPDVVHLHNIHGYYINIKILFDYLKTLGKPVVWTLHDCWAFTGHCAHFDYAGCEKWKTECYDCPEKMSYPTSLIFDNSRKNYLFKKETFTGINDLTLVAPSDWLAGLVKQSFLNRYPVRVINNGIDLEIFKPTSSDIREKYDLENKFVILGVANRWSYRKGFSYFIQLSERIKQDEVIVMAGLSKKQKKAMPKGIIGIARTGNMNELAELYTTADVFVNPTLEEVMGLTNVEALACGTPVITFVSGGSIECIDEKTGYAAKKESVDDLLEGIRKLKERNNFAEECRSRAIKLYNRKDRFMEYVDLYCRVTAKK